MVGQKSAISIEDQGAFLQCWCGDVNGLQVTGTPVFFSLSISLLFGVYCAHGACEVRHICAVPHTSDGTIEVIVAGEIVMLAGTALRSDGTDQMQSEQQSLRQKGFLLSLHLVGH